MKTNWGLPGKVSLLLVMLLIIGLAGFGCVGIKSVPEGGSGGAIANGVLYIAPAVRSSSSGGFSCSATTGVGKLVALNTSDGSRVWPDVTLESSAPAGGGFGCAPASPKTVTVYGTPAVAGELVYIGGYNGKIYAINSSNGAKRWVYPREGSLQPIVGGLVTGQDKVYFGGADGKVYALDAETGDWEWEFQGGDKIWATPAIEGDTLYIGSFDKKLYALNANDGSERWEFETEGAIIATPLVFNDTVYIGTIDRYFYAVGAADGSLKWRAQIEAKNWFWAKAVARDNVIYAPCLDGKVYILDADSGREIADAIDLGSPISSSPVLVDSLVVIVSEEGKVHSLDTANNQIKQLANLEATVRAPLCSSDGVVYIRTEEDTLYALNAQSGTARRFDIK